MKLSKEELAVYQSKLDDVLQVSVLGSKWQAIGVLRKYTSPYSISNQELNNVVQTQSGAYIARRQHSSGTEHIYAMSRP